MASTRIMGDPWELVEERLSDERFAPLVLPAFRACRRALAEQRSAAQEHLELWGRPSQSALGSRACSVHVVNPLTLQRCVLRQPAAENTTQDEGQSDKAAHQRDADGWPPQRVQARPPLAEGLEHQGRERLVVCGHEVSSALALLPAGMKIACLRADSGFFEKEFAEFLEQRGMPYIVVARMSQRVPEQCRAIKQWRALDENYAIAEFQTRSMRWNRTLRLVVVRERAREKEAVGRPLLEVPGYTFRVWVTNRTEEPEDVW